MVETRSARSVAEDGDQDHAYPYQMRSCSRAEEYLDGLEEM